MIKVLELFAGIGACSKALTNLGIEHEIVDAVEIDKYAVASFNAIHGTNFEPQDITKWDKDIECDLVMHGSPCQDFSVAGKQAGGDEGSGTRSSLMYETLRIVEKLRPKYVIWENVKNLLSKKHRHNFDAYLETMKGLGYTNYYQVLNAKNYGIPQNRERVFTISIRADISQNFVFPEPIPLERRLKDILEDNVDEKYYLSETQVDRLVNSNYDQNKRFYGINGISPTISTMGGGQRQPKIVDDIYKNRQPRVYDNAPTLRANHAWDLEVVEPNLKTNPQQIGVVVTNQGKYIKRETDIATTLMARDYKGFGNQEMTGVVNESLYRIRKLTPKECWRLMGFDDSDFDKASKVNSNTQLYKQAGNSIVVNVLEAILKELLCK